MTDTRAIYRLDRNHVGIRLVVLLVMVLAALLGLFIILPAVMSLLGLSGLPELCLTVVGTLLLGVGASWAVEQGLRAVWPSGRWLVLDERHITLQKASEAIVLTWNERINVLAWHFVIQRGRSWVPRGWYCAAIRLTQDEKTITPYTFVKPAVATESSLWPAFELLVSRKQAPKRGEEHLMAKMAEQGQLRGAEKDRWQEGVEMQSEDFFTLVSEIGKRLSDWPPEETK